MLDISQVPEFQLGVYSGRVVGLVALQYVTGVPKLGYKSIPALIYLARSIADPVHELIFNVIPMTIQGRSYNSMDYAIGEGTQVGKWFQDYAKLRKDKVP